MTKHQGIAPKELKRRLAELPREEDLKILCMDCGEKRYNRKVGCCTMYMGVCDLCGEKKTCTEVRDFLRGTIIRTD